jgi:hypothetical protein
MRHQETRNRPTWLKAVNGLRAIASAALTLCLAGNASVADAQSKADEFHLKAAFIFHFFELVEWPPDALGPDNRPLTLCTLGENPLGGALSAMIEGKMVGTRPVHLRHLGPKPDFQGCQALFVDSDEPTRLPLLIARIKGAPILTVGETEEFVKQGGMIGLCVEGKKVRLEINQDASLRAGLKISSRLLLLAKNVIGGRN